MGTAIYAQSQQEGGAEGAGADASAGATDANAGAQADDEVVDAEIVDDEDTGKRQGGAA